MLSNLTKECSKFYSTTLGSIVIPIKKGLYSEAGSFSFDSETLSLVKSSGNMLQNLVINQDIDSKKVLIIKLDI